MEVIFEAQEQLTYMSLCDGCDMVDDTGVCHGTDQ